jgi:hypothetical protein
MVPAKSFGATAMVGSRGDPMDLKSIFSRAAARIPLAPIVAVALAGAATSCTNHHDGTLQQNWTIAQTTNAATCGVHGATQARLIVFDPGLVIHATQFAPCDAFQTSLSLNPDTYTSTLTFVDGNNVPVSETRSIAAFTINSNETTTLSADFPIASFFH